MNNDTHTNDSYDEYSDSNTDYGYNYDDNEDSVDDCYTNGNNNIINIHNDKDNT